MFVLLNRPRRPASLSTRLGDRVLPGGFYHVMLRGNGGADIFFSKADRRRFLALS